jgi:outer membrane protein assembly factor BamB
VQAGDAGSYHVVVENALGSVTSREAVLNVLPLPDAPDILVPPASHVVALGANTSLTVVASGEGHLQYQWKKDGVALSSGGRIGGVNTPTLTIQRALVSEAGSYTVEVSNEGGTTASQAAEVVVDLSQARAGSVLWEFRAANAIRSAPAIGAGGRVYVGSDDGNVYAVNGSIGTKLWEFGTGSRVYTGAAIGADGTVYVGCYRGTVYALDGVSGAKRWEFETGGYQSTPAVGAEGSVYVGSLAGKVYALDGVTGSQRWEYATGGAVLSSPVVGEDGTVYVGTQEGTV